MILAQLPDLQLQLLLYAKVTKYMLYGPCDVNNPQAKCMVNGKYNKHFSKKYSMGRCQGCAKQKRSDPEWSRITLEWKGVDNKVGEQLWPQLMRCASICCCTCGCVFQEDRIVVRSAGEEWYID